MTYDPGRPMMGAAELAVHQLTTYGRDYTESDNGYDDMNAEAKRDWEALPDWGRDGWNLGNWPYVSVLRRDRILEPPAESPYELMSICEGDRTVYGFATERDRNAALDYLFLWYAAGKDWAPLTEADRTQLDLAEFEPDPKFRGPTRFQDGPEA